MIKAANKYTTMRESMSAVDFIKGTFAPEIFTPSRTTAAGRGAVSLLSTADGTFLLVMLARKEGVGAWQVTSVQTATADRALPRYQAASAAVRAVG